jgi:type II secretory pathway component PulJ
MSRSAERPRQAAAFTILELLVAIAVLAMMMLLLSQILGSVSSMWLNGQRRVKNFSEARAMLDLFARDIQCGVFRPDLAAFPGSSIAFYTRRPGISSGSLRDVSLVQYALSTNCILQRGDFAVRWNDPANTIPFGNTADFSSNQPTARDTAPGVLGFRVQFLYADGTRSTNYTVSTANPLRALGFALAVVDEQTLQKIPADKMQSLRDGLSGAVSPSGNVKSDWENYLRNSLDWTSYPKSLSQGLKIFERYVILPNT